MALIAIRRQPVAVPASRGPALVPNSGMADPRAAAVLAALADQTGALSNPLVDPNSSAAAPLADEAAAQVALNAGQGGPARGGALIDQPRQPAPIEAPDDPGVPGMGQTGGFDVMTMLKGLGAAAGKSGGGDIGGAAVRADQAANSPGLLDKIKSLFLGAKPAIDPATVQTPNMQPDQIGALDAGGPGLPGDDPSGGPTARPSIDEDAAPGLARVAAAQSAPGALDAGPDPETIDPALASQDLGQNQPALTAGDSAAPSLDGRPVGEEPNFLDKLRGNPLALMLITGGLGTMAAASRRGATPLGAIGEGMSGGLRTAFETQAGDRERALNERRQDTADRRESDEEVLRGKQGAFYDARTTAEPEKTAALATRAAASTTNADASKVRAGAAVTNADASKVRADASRVRADAYAKGGAGGKTGQFEQKRQAWLAINPGDDQGALTYANGKAALSPSQKYLAARRLATSQLNGMISAPDDPEKFLTTTTNSILKTMDANDAKAAPPPKPGAPAPAPALGGPAPKVNVGAFRAQAQDAMKKGAPPDQVRARYKKLTGQNADF